MKAKSLELKIAIAGEALWTRFSTSQLLAEGSTAVASPGTLPAAEILFFYVK
jgi:hypothetical protein